VGLETVAVGAGELVTARGAVELTLALRRAISAAVGTAAGALEENLPVGLVDVVAPAGELERAVARGARELAAAAGALEAARPPGLPEATSAFGLPVWARARGRSGGGMISARTMHSVRRGRGSPWAWETCSCTKKDRESRSFVQASPSLGSTSTSSSKPMYWLPEPRAWLGITK